VLLYLFSLSLRELLFFEEVILHPKGKTVHDDWNYHNHDNQLEHLIFFDPSHQGKGDLFQTILKSYLETEQDALIDYHYRNPDEQLD
jgi:hypothetical protein